MVTRVVSVLLALVLCISSPVPVYAVELVEETQPPEVIIEVVESSANTQILETIEYFSGISNDYLRIISGCVVFFVVVVLCYFVYKFFRMFF